ncbi:MAG: hypothetical protein V3R25_07905, partial [Nitrosomonadaceae bacterium]
ISSNAKTGRTGSINRGIRSENRVKRSTCMALIYHEWSKGCGLVKYDRRILCICFPDSGRSELLVYLLLSALSGH